MDFADEIKNLGVLKVVTRAAKKLKFPTYLVGGYVRDLALGKQGKDLDLVCVGSGIDLANMVSTLLPAPTKVTIFKNFGTAMLTYDGYELEFVGARKESYRKSSRKPIVENGTLEDDQNRRDFTINAMAISLNSQDYGLLIDPFDGMMDLKRKLIKTPLDPEVTFSDDPLRMMRAIRFATQLEFDIEADTFRAITQYAGRLEIVSRERITDELNKILLTDKPSYGFKLLFISGLLQVFFPVLAKLHGVEKIGNMAHKDNFYHTLQVLDNICKHTDNLWLRWAALLHDIAKPATKRFDPKAGWTFHGHEDKGARMVPKIFRQLRLPLDDRMKYVQKMVRLHLRPIALVNKQVTDSAIRRLIYEAGDDLEDLMTLCRADITSKNNEKVKKYLRNFDKVEKRVLAVEENDQVRNFQPVITGEIIMKTFGIPPSKMVGEIKEALKEAVLDGEVKNEYAQALNFILKLGQSKGLQAKDSKQI
ncbi:MAG: tRNA nucleotidyltransferase [Cyclobacteriaceae bacterium]|nr:MAG: tRNA nucleotidyltransferase [Cyclobacteriaceae bacterium]